MKESIKTAIVLSMTALLLVFASCVSEGEDGKDVTTNNGTPGGGGNNTDVFVLTTCWDNTLDGYLQMDPGPTHPHQEKILVNGCATVQLVDDQAICSVWVDCTDIPTGTGQEAWCAENFPPNTILVDQVNHLVPTYETNRGYKVELVVGCSQ